MCVNCDDLNEKVLADPTALAELKSILADLDDLEAATAMCILEENGIPVPKPSEVDNDSKKALLSVAETHPFQVAVAARDACVQVEDFKAALSEVFNVSPEDVDSAVKQALAEAK